MTGQDERVITNDSPVAKVFGRISGPPSLPEIRLSLVEVKDMQRLPNSGHTFRGVLKMATMRFRGVTETTEFSSTSASLVSAKAAPGARSRLRFDPKGLKKQVAFEAENAVPAPLVARILARIGHAQHARGP